MKKRFDAAMMHIDANIQNDAKSIKQGLVQETGYSFTQFNNFFLGLTGMTLNHYITLRKMYYASEELRFSKEKSIVDIALEFGYSEQSSFTRAFSAYTNLTPNDVRKGIDFVQDNKIRLSNFTGTANKRMQHIMERWNETEDISAYNLEYIVDIEKASEDFGFSLELCEQIADIADQLGIPPYGLIESCFAECMKFDENNEFKNLTRKEQFALEHGLSSEEELNNICKHYQCEYYDLDGIMIELYKNNI